ncbi:MAG: phage portal protein [Chloroflexota bacterium]
MLPTSDDEWVARLSQLHDRERPGLVTLNNEYELLSSRAYMHPEIFREIGDRLQQVVIAWPQLVVDSVEERLDPEGFRLPDQSDADDDLWRVWQENNADEGSQLGRVDALVMKRSYVCVGTNADDRDTPLITFESPLEMYADIDPRTRKVRAVLRRTVDPEASPSTTIQTPNGIAPGNGVGTQYATLYLPNKTQWRENGIVIDEDVHNLGEVPVAPVVNRARLSDQLGRSELSPILPLAQAANKIATDMMVAAEFVALPLRGIFGIGPDDIEDAKGNKLTALQAILGRLLAIPDDDGTAKTFEFASANLANFHETINQLARLVASIAGLPPHYLGLTTENPPSADSIRSAEMRLVKRAERKMVPIGGGYEQTMRLVKRLQEGDWDPRYKRLETIWRDPSTPTIAQKADAAVKLYNLPKPIVPLRQTREGLGYTDAQIARMEEADKQAAVADPLTQIANQLSARPTAPAFSDASAN